MADVTGEGRAAVHADAEVAAQVVVQRATGGGHEAELVLVGLMRHAGDEQGLRPAGDHVGADPADIELDTCRAEDLTDLLQPIAADGRGEPVEAADAHEGHHHLAVLARCVAVARGGRAGQPAGAAPDRRRRDRRRQLR